DRAGRTVQSMKSTSGKFTISAEGLTSGMYFYQVTDGDWISTGKVVMR
ncbi:MAG: T9SS type A sorting domain-containing protein, partial [Flavobacteriales bacterium]|nr:T9SS type A sorting domain-containing protein [Flavobacteriales bacterium]